MVASAAVIIPAHSSTSDHIPESIKPFEELLLILEIRPAVMIGTLYGQFISNAFFKGFKDYR